MSRIYDNWEKLVAAVIKREEFWELCHAHSRNTSISSSISSSSDFGSSFRSQSDDNAESARTEAQETGNGLIGGEWTKTYQHGVYITIAVEHGVRQVNRVRFSKRDFDEGEAETWWHENQHKVYAKYNAWGGVALRYMDNLLKSGKGSTEEYDPGIYITVAANADGTNALVRVRFSRRRYEDHEAEEWWQKNRADVYKKYNVNLAKPEMSRIYDNWEKLVGAVIKREEIWELCHAHSRNTSISSCVSSSSSDFDSSFLSQLDESMISLKLEVQETMNGIIDREWKEIYETGVNITIAALDNGITRVEQADFSKICFNEADAWWNENKYKVYGKYNAWGGVVPHQQDELLRGEEIVLEWIENYEPGVYITLCASINGTADMKRMHFSKKIFNEHRAEEWWHKNKEDIDKRYNVRVPA